MLLPKRSVLFAGALAVFAMRASAAAEPVFHEEMTIAEIEQGIGAHRFTCTQLIDYYLKRIERFDKSGPAINAILTLNEGARDEAKQLDAAFGAHGMTGPLHCIPIALKDNIATSDLPTTGGSLALKDWHVGQDASVVQRLRKAGAIILAKANLHEIALVGLTYSSLGGQTRNPYDLTRTPGGSSGGPGAAVAANFVVAALGTDTQNSIRSPASAMSIVGLRPTKGLVARDGVIPASPTQDALGPLARNAADIAAILAVIEGYDPKDDSTAWVAGKTFENYLGGFRPDALKGARIGILRSMFGKDKGEEGQVNRVMARAIEALRKAGAVLVEINEPAFVAEKLLAENDVMAFEFRDAFNAYLKHYPNAPIGNLDALIASGKYDKASLQGFFDRANVADSPQRQADYDQRLVRDNNVRQKLIAWFAKEQLDAMIYPEQRRLVVKIGETDQAGRTGILAAVTGFPAVTVPAGFSEPSTDAPIGVPIGMDILGRPFTEGRLLAIANSFEGATKARQLPPGFRD